jgi:hypothetical protein
VKASPKKIVALVVIIAVFCIGALTNRWAAKSGYDHINHRSDQAEESVPDSISYSNRVDDLSAYSDRGQTEPETENRFITAWISRSEDSSDPTELRDRAGDYKLDRVGRNSVESVSPQDSGDPDNSQDTYGDADVE